MALPKQPTTNQLKLNINAKNYQTTIPSLNTIQKDFKLQDPQKYADTISKANAQAKLDGINSQRDLVNQNLQDSQKSLETDYFQQYRGQREQNALRGLNAGVESQRTNLLQMNQSQQMSKLMQDANRTKLDLARQTSTVEVQRQADALQIRNTELQRQIDLAFKKGDFLQAENSRRMQLDVQKEQQRVGVVWNKYSTNVDNHYKNLADARQQEQARLERVRIANQEKQFNQDMSFKRSQASADAQRQREQMAWDREKFGRSQAAAERASRRAASAASAQRSAAASQAAALKNRAVDSVVLSVKNGHASGQQAMQKVMSMYTAGDFQHRDGDYRDAVKAISSANATYWKNGKYVGRH